LNCCTRISVRLFDIPHTKNTTVVIRKANIPRLGKIEVRGAVEDFWLVDRRLEVGGAKCIRPP
jgi:hypothetical protein